MKPQEILDELDRLQITIWYQQIGPDQDPFTLIRHPASVPPELASAIKEHTGTLLKISGFEPSRQAAGIFYRKPKGAE